VIGQLTLTVGVVSVRRVGIRSVPREGRSLSVLRLIAGVVAVGSLTVGAAPASAASDHGPGSVVGTHPDLTHGLRVGANGISCVSARVCLVAGRNDKTSVGEIAEVVKGKPTTYRSVPGTGAIDAISCPSATSDCEAVGFTPSPSFLEVALTVSRRGVPHKPVTIADATEDSFNAVSCFRSLASCEAVGQGPTGESVALVALHNGIPGTPQNVPVAAGNFVAGVAISCPAAAWCEAVGNVLTSTLPNARPTGFAVAINGGTPAAGRTAASFGLAGIACSSTGRCRVVGSNKAGHGFVATLNGHATTRPHEVKGASLNALSCSSPTNCTAVGTTVGKHAAQAAVLAVVRGKPGPIDTVAGPESLTGVASSTDGFYEAIGQALPGANTSKSFVTSN
jgi:hypothetical protein